MLSDQQIEMAAEEASVRWGSDILELSAWLLEQAESLGVRGEYIDMVAELNQSLHKPLELPETFKKRVHIVGKLTAPFEMTDIDVEGRRGARPEDLIDAFIAGIQNRPLEQEMNIDQGQAEITEIEIDWME